jgi:hypothetical protein
VTTQCVKVDADFGGLEQRKLPTTADFLSGQISLPAADIDSVLIINCTNDEREGADVKKPSGLT